MSTAPLAAPERSRLTLSETLADSRVMTARQLRKTLRRPTYIVFSFVQPVIFVLLFRYVFGGAIKTGGVAYVDFLMPGIFVQTSVFGSLVTGLGLTEDLKAGIVDRFRSLPIARSALLLGRTASDLLTNVLTLQVMFLVGIAVGFRPSQPAWSVILGLMLVLAFSYAFSWISAFVGLSVRDPETAQSAGFIWVFPAHLRLLGLRATVDDARRDPGLRAGEPDHDRRRCRPRFDDRPGQRARADARVVRLARRAAARVRAAVRAGLPTRVSESRRSGHRRSVVSRSAPVLRRLCEKRRRVVRREPEPGSPDA